MSDPQPVLFDPPSRRPRQPMPDWLVRQLDDAGWIDTDLGASRRARAAHCPHCGGYVLRGLDADMCALTVDCDPVPLAAEGEALARLFGLRTYELRRGFAHRYEIDARDQWRIAGRPVGTRGVDVLVAHQCSPVATLPRAAPQIAGDEPATPGQPQDTGQPPF